MPVDTVVRRYERPLQIGNVRLSRPCLAAVVAIVMLMGSSGKAHAQDNVTIYADSTAQLIRGYGGAYIHFWRPDKIGRASCRGGVEFEGEEGKEGSCDG